MAMKVQSTSILRHKKDVAEVSLGAPDGVDQPDAMVAVLSSKTDRRDAVGGALFFATHEQFAELPAEDRLF